MAEKEKAPRGVKEHLKVQSESANKMKKEDQREIVIDAHNIRRVKNNGT